MHRPAFPYKFKFKASGCPNDCVAAIARADLSRHRHLEGRRSGRTTRRWRSTPPGASTSRRTCATAARRSAWTWDGATLTIDNGECVRCMHCINVMPKALRPGVERGAAILIGAKAPIVQGAMLSSVLVPFMTIEPPYTELKELVAKIWDFWGEEGKNRERVGEFIQRVGTGEFPGGDRPGAAAGDGGHPRENPYVFYEEYFEEEKQGGIRSNVSISHGREPGEDRYRSAALREVPAADHQGELREVEVPRDPARPG